MGSCDNCNDRFCSRVEFYDGPSSASPYLGRFCSRSERKAKVSNGNQMFVYFYSSFDRDRGFQAEYSETTEDPSPTEVIPTVPSTTGIGFSFPLLYIYGSAHQGGRKGGGREGTEEGGREGGGRDRREGGWEPVNILSIFSNLGKCAKVNICMSGT